MELREPPGSPARRKLQHEPCMNNTEKASAKIGRDPWPRNHAPFGAWLRPSTNGSEGGTRMTNRMVRQSGAPQNSNEISLCLRFREQKKKIPLRRFHPRLKEKVPKTQQQRSAVNEILRSLRVNFL